MATSQAVSGTGTAAAIGGGGSANAIGETVVGSHVLKIDRFSATKDLGVGKSIKSSTFFSVGGHAGWYMECYPCGVDEGCRGWVSIFLCRSIHNEEVLEAARFIIFLVDHDGYPLWNWEKIYNYNDTSGRWGIAKFVERAELQLALMDDRFQIRCDVSRESEFPAVLPPDLHRPLTLRDIIASGVHRGLPTTAAGTSSKKASAEHTAGSHVRTIDGYSNAKQALRTGDNLHSKSFKVGEHRWFLELYPNDKTTLGLVIYLVKAQGRAVKVRFELTLLTLAREVIWSTQSCYAFSGPKNARCGCHFLGNMEAASSPLLRDGFHVKCDIAIVDEITAVRPPDLHLQFCDLLASQVGADVEFEVGRDLFSAHKLVLATRSSAFMADFFGPAGNGSSTTVTRLRIADMEPRVFKALLHFIYTDTLPEVHEEDKSMMAQGLLVAADRYGMERLKLICGDMLCNYMNDACMAVDMLELAVKHGCHRLKEKCKDLLKGHLAKVAP